MGDPESKLSRNNQENKEYIQSNGTWEGRVADGREMRPIEGSGLLMSKEL